MHTDQADEFEPDEKSLSSTSVSLSENELGIDDLIDRLENGIHRVVTHNFVNADSAFSVALWGVLINKAVDGLQVSFEEYADSVLTAKNPGSVRLVVHGGFCGTKLSSFEEMVIGLCDEQQFQALQTLGSEVTRVMDCERFGMTPLSGAAREISTDILQMHSEGAGNLAVCRYAENTVRQALSLASDRLTVKALAPHIPEVTLTGTARPRHKQSSTGKALSSHDLRELFLDFYVGKGFVEINGASVIPRNDPTLLFINSGMAPLKGYFTGDATPPSPKISNIQTCVRTNDIESIGDTYHLTSFEMMGNWTFGTLSKREAISQAWELINRVFGLKQRVVVSYYGGDDRFPNIPPDIDSKKIWQDLGFSENQIFPLGADDNLWGPAGDSGPCGPCSEIFIDLGEKVGNDSNEGPDSESGRFIEIWNPGVFMEYHMYEDKRVTPLAAKSLDAGAGVERWAMILQQKDCVYEIDSIAPILDVFATGTGLDRASRAARILTDHIRTACTLVSDNIRPGNQGPGYVLRRLIRRAATQAELNGIAPAKIEEAVRVTMSINKHRLPNDENSVRSVVQVVRSEVSGFLRTLDRGRRELEKMMQGTSGDLSGDKAFYLRETLGLPFEIAEEIAAREGRRIDKEGYQRALERHQEVSKA